MVTTPGVQREAREEEVITSDLSRLVLLRKRLEPAALFMKFLGFIMAPWFGIQLGFRTGGPPGLLLGLAGGTGLFLLALRISKGMKRGEKLSNFLAFVILIGYIYFIIETIWGFLDSCAQAT